MNLRQILHINDSMFQIYRTIREEPDLNIDGIKKFWKCSHAFRKDGLLYFCREIQTIEYENINLQDHEQATTT